MTLVLDKGIGDADTVVDGYVANAYGDEALGDNFAVYY